MRNGDTIRATAQRTRTYLEEVAKREGFDSDLECMCAIGAAALHVNLVWAGVQGSKIFYTDTHCWVGISGKIVDITATQFGYDRIFIAGAHTWRDSQWYDSDATKYRSVARFITRLEHEGWPDEQIPKPHHLQYLY